MNTLREPLMLSDTAMVLLRRYVETLEDALGYHSIQSNFLLYDSFIFSDPMLVLADEFVMEIWFLWLSPDVVPIRHLSWHLTLNERCMHMVELMFKPSQTHRPIIIRSRSAMFMSLIASL